MKLLKLKIHHIFISLITVTILFPASLSASNNRNFLLFGSYGATFSYTCYSTEGEIGSNLETAPFGAIGTITQNAIVTFDGSGKALLKSQDSFIFNFSAPGLSIIDLTGIDITDSTCDLDYNVDKSRRVSLSGTCNSEVTKGFDIGSNINFSVKDLADGFVNRNGQNLELTTVNTKPHIVTVTDTSGGVQTFNRVCNGSHSLIKLTNRRYK